MGLAPRIRAAAVAAVVVPFVSAQQCGPWQWVNPVPRPVNLTTVASGNGMVLALGAQVATSFDGVSWDVRDAVPPPFVAPDALWGWNDAIWDGARFVAVGGPYIASSYDGASWSLRHAGDTYPPFRGDEYLGIAFRDGRYVAVAYNGWAMSIVALTSTDLVHWSQVAGRNLPEFLQPRAITATGSSFVVVGWGSGALIDGDASAMQGVPGANGADVAWNGHELVAVSESGARRSLDGLTWQAVSTPRTGLTGVTWTGSEFVAVGLNGAVVTSPDGVTWTDHSIGDQVAANRVIWTGERLVAVGNNILTSDDGIAWHPWARQVTSANLGGVAWNDSAFVAVGSHGEIVRSPDGVAWTRTRAPGGGFGSAGGLESIVWTGSRFVGVGPQGLPNSQGLTQPGALVVTSPNGVIWKNTPLAANLESVAWNGERLLAIGWGNGSYDLASSEDQTTWRSVATPPEWSCCWTSFAIVAIPGRFVVSLGPSTLATSTEADAWTTASLPEGSWLTQLVAGGGTFVAYGQEVFASTDGSTWAPAIGTGGATAVIWVGDHFLAWDDQGNTLRSDDGVVWEPAYDAPAAPPEGVGSFAMGAGAIAGVGTGGVIARSACAGPRQVRRHAARLR